jgi:hypothetical protein
MRSLEIFVSKLDIHPLLLGHEQLQFDIAEVFARKLRKEFAASKLHTGNVDEEAKGLYHKAMLEYHNFQQMFDIETHHGIEKDTQLKWERRITEELKHPIPSSSNHSLIFCFKGEQLVTCGCL